MKKFAIAIAAAFALFGVAATASAQSHDHGMRSGGSWHGGGSHSDGNWHGGSNWRGGDWRGGDWHGHRFFGPRFGFSFGFPVYSYWGPYYGYYGYPYAYPYYPYTYYDSGPQVYIEKDSGDAVAPVAPARPSAVRPSDYSYYCTDPAGYYPQVPSCPSGWLKVVPNSGPPR